LTVALQRAARLLATRLEALEGEVDREPSRWPEYVATVNALAALLPNLAPERGGALLTTAEMAGRLGISAKTPPPRKADGGIRRALQRGKLIRWRGDEITR